MAENPQRHARVCLFVFKHSTSNPWLFCRSCECWVTLCSFRRALGLSSRCLCKWALCSPNPSSLSTFSPLSALISNRYTERGQLGEEFLQGLPFSIPRTVFLLIPIPVRCQILHLISSLSPYGDLRQTFKQRWMGKGTAFRILNAVRCNSYKPFLW